MTFLELIASVAMLPVVPSDVEPVQFAPGCGALVFPIAAGLGLAVENGKQVTIQFLVVDDNGREIASTIKRGMPYTMVVGSAHNDPVLAAILSGARYGEQRMAYCPPDGAYGPAGITAIVPKGRQLTFYMQVMMPPRKQAKPAAVR